MSELSLSETRVLVSSSETKPQSAAIQLTTPVQQGSVAADQNATQPPDQLIQAPRITNLSFNNDLAQIYLMQQLTSIQSDFTSLNRGFTQSLNIWNKTLLPGLNLEELSIEENSEDFTQLTEKNLQDLKFKAVAEPSSISEVVWESLPDKIESADYDGPDGEDSWSDTRLPPGSYQNLINLKNNKTRFSLTITCIESLLTMPDFMGIQLTAIQIEDLQNKKAILQEQLEKLEKIENQFFTLGKLVRTTKTIKNLFSEDAGKHIKDNFIDKYVNALNNAHDPAARAQILAQMRKELRDLMGDLAEFQIEGFSDIRDRDSQRTTTNSTEKSQSEEYFEYVISKVMEKLYKAFGEGFGDYIADNPLFDIEESANRSPIPTEDFSNIKDPAQKEAWEKLYSFFGQVYSGGTIMTLEVLSPFVDELKASGAISDSSEETQDYSDTRKVNLHYQNAVSIVSSTKETFSEFFEPNDSNTRPIQGSTNETKMNFSNILVGFIPFCSSEEKQHKLETILETEEFKNMYSNMALKAPNITPSILSRIMFLYNRMTKEGEKADTSS
ncbi:MAG: hypothetical protein SFU25_10095 [Candidatus Caenarcaniphilales bacterium]|nr:hypothetical protein [Candidatus Caenarcaniphilales bacterium]